MHSWLRFLALSLFITGVVGSAWIVAEDQPPGAENPPAADPGQSLTPESLEALLTSMNYRVTRQEASTGGPFFAVQATVGGQKYPITLCVLTADPRMLYFSMALGTVEDPAQIGADKALALLSENNRITPAHFAFDPELKQFFLFTIISNSGVTKQLLLQEFGRIATISERAKSAWNK